jgi:hypothetical protein
MVETRSRPDLAAYETAVRLDPHTLVKELRSLLGVRLVAVIAGVRETRAVHEWAEGTRDIRNPTVLPRLRLAYQAAKLVADADSAAIAQAWMQGLNPLLDDRSPAMTLREDEPEEAGPQVLAAARQFAANG